MFTFGKKFHIIVDDFSSSMLEFVRTLLDRGPIASVLIVLTHWHSDHNKNIRAFLLKLCKITGQNGFDPGRVRLISSEMTLRLARVSRELNPGRESERKVILDAIGRHWVTVGFSKKPPWTNSSTASASTRIQHRCATHGTLTLTFYDSHHIPGSIMFSTDFDPPRVLPLYGPSAAPTRRYRSFFTGDYRLAHVATGTVHHRTVPPLDALYLDGLYHNRQLKFPPYKQCQLMVERLVDSLLREPTCDKVFVQSNLLGAARILLSTASKLKIVTCLRHLDSYMQQQLQTVWQDERPGPRVAKWDTYFRTGPLHDHTRCQLVLVSKSSALPNPTDTRYRSIHLSSMWFACGNNARYLSDLPYFDPHKHCYRIALSNHSTFNENRSMIDRMSDSRTKVRLMGLPVGNLVCKYAKPKTPLKFVHDLQQTV